MSVNKAGTLIKESRTKAGLSQQAVAEQIPGISASDISKAERGEKEFTQDQYKALAKVLGITQKSLLEAAGLIKKTTTTAAKTASTSTAKKPASSAKADDFTVSATEKKLVELYRKADSDTKKKVMSILKGEKSETEQMLGNILESAMGAFMKK